MFVIVGGKGPLGH